MQINLKHFGKVKKIKCPKPLDSTELQRLIGKTFELSDRVVGVSDAQGKFYELSQIPKNGKQLLLITAKDVNQDSMSFASEFYQKQAKEGFQTQQDHGLHEGLPAAYQTKCIGIISDLSLFQELILPENGISIVACFTSVRPPLDTPYHYHLLQGQTDSVLVYSGLERLCEFFVQNWNQPNPQIACFIQGLKGQQLQQSRQSKQSGQFRKKQKAYEEVDEQVDLRKQNEETTHNFLQNLGKLYDQGQMTALQYYKLKAQLLESPSDFFRKYEKGFRSNSQSREIRQIVSREVVSKEERGRSANRRYQIPIIVRKYNNVVEKISTSYPLTLEQEQAINLIQQLELKGIINEKEARQLKSSVLQEDAETFRLFKDYFSQTLDQMELANKLRRRKLGGQQLKQRSQQDMRLLIKYAKQNSYELLRNLALEGDKYVLKSIQDFKNCRNAQQFAQILQKVAAFYRAKQQLQRQ